MSMQQNGVRFPLHGWLFLCAVGGCSGTPASGTCVSNSAVDIVVSLAANKVNVLLGTGTGT